MTGLLELREKLKLIYSKNEVFILPVIKFLIAFAALSMVNGQLGYMSRIDSPVIVLIVALLCSFLPRGCIILFAAAFSLLHMYALSLEVTIVGFCVFLVMFLLFFRFSPRDSLVVVLTPMLFAFKIPYVMPVAMGLLGTPASAVSVGCGVAVYYFLSNIAANATRINTMGAEEATAKLRMVIDGLLNNKEMIVVIAAFAITVITVYLIRRMSIDHAWTIAMIAGVIINLVILLVGDLMYDTNMSLLAAILGSVVAIAAAKLLEFFRFCVDYSRTEKVQFEDDEYYYYVKAVPKMTVAAQTRTVKKINTQRRPAMETAGNGGRSNVAGGAGSRSGGAGSRSASGNGHNDRGYSGSNTRNVTGSGQNSRSVMTERTLARSGAPGSRNAYRDRPAGRSVTVKGRMAETDDFDDLGDL